jgi:predicted ATPase/DNA-binding SARP family transcriptional activator
VSRVQFRILGPLEVERGERLVALGGTQQRALLGLLLLRANQPMSSERLVEELWGEPTPTRAVKRLQVAVARLRKALDGNRPGVSGNTRLRTVSGGYVLAVAPGELDADVFQARVEDGRQALAGGGPARAAEVLREALGLWRGPALSDVGYERFAQAEIRRLEELRLAALEARVEADLRLGAHASLIGEVEALVAEHPTRERLTGLLMLALYRCGRQAEALDAFQRARAHLAAELGLEPGPALKALQARIFEQSASLELAADDAEASVGLRDASLQPVRLPARSTELLGREADTRAVIDLLGRQDVRLVTLTGVGGVGKTSLALEVAHRLAGELPDGSAFVDLAPLSDPARAAETVLHVLGCTPEPGATATETLCRLVAARDQLLVLDNLEHLLAGTPLLGDLLDAAPRLKLLATSRAALNLRAEHRYPLDPLALPDSREPVAVAAAPATALFIARATARDPAFRVTADGAEAIATVCARVDGVPLAIELAAARTGTLSPQEIAHRLEHILATLGSGGRDAPDRQRTLRATLDWSYQLLDEPERVAFARLAVFAGGCTLDAAHVVTGASLDVIEGLIAQSMLTRRSAADGETRLGMLEPVREYAAERLVARPDHEQLGARHSRYYLKLAEAAHTPSGRVEQLKSFDRLDAEADNFRGALTRDRRRGPVERALRLATALEDWWQDRALWVEGRRWIEDALEASDDRITPALRANALRVISQLCVHQADFARAIASGRAALELYRDLHDASGVARCLALLAAGYSVVGDSVQGRRAAAEAVKVSERADARARAFALQMFAGTTPDIRAALSAANEAATLYERQDDVVGLARLWATLGLALLSRGATDDAEPLLDRSLGLAAEANDLIGGTFTLGKLGILAVENGDVGIAAERLAETLVRSNTYGLRRPVGEALGGLAAIAAGGGDLQRAARLAGAAAAVRFGQSIEPAEQRLHVSILQPARRELGEQSWRAAYEAGLHLSVEDALTLGLQTARDYSAARSRPARSGGGQGGARRRLGIPARPAPKLLDVIREAPRRPSP